MKRVLLLALMGLVASCSSLLSSKSSILPHTETVLTTGMRITATNPNGTVTIEADGAASRIISGIGWSKRPNLIPRTTRWNGSLGLYDPAPSNSLHDRLLVNEGRLFFGSESEASRFLNHGSNARGKPVFNNQGLVVAYEVLPISSGAPTRFVSLWQIYINGKRPTALKGADDSAIKVSGGAILDIATPFPAPIGYEMVLGEE